MQFRLRSLGNFGLFTRRAIFVWPWNENSRTKQKQQTNGNRAIGLVYRTDTNARGFWLVERTFGWKNLYTQELRFDVILQHDWPIEQCVLHIRVFFGGKTKRPCFDLFIYWLIKQITNACRNYFSRLYENRSNLSTEQLNTQFFNWSKIRLVWCELALVSAG